MKLLKRIAAVTAMALGLVAMPTMTASAQAGSPFIGEVRIFPLSGSWCPRDWARADGSIVSINDYQALYSLIGTTYGGDGRVSFALPDLRGALPLHNGTGPGLSTWVEGERFGWEENTLTVAQLPPHDHALRAAADSPDSTTPAGASLTEVGRNSYKSSPSLTLDMAQRTVQTGNGLPVNNIQPVTVLNYCIALDGLYPSRS